MEKVGQRVSCTVEEIIGMKTDEKAFARFVHLSSAWLAATSYRMARTSCQRASASEFRAWLSYGLWDAVGRFDERGRGVGMIYDMAVWSAQNAYKSQYGNAAQKTADLSVSSQKNADGEMEEILIPSFDENLASQDFRDYMASVREILDEKDYLILQKRVEGKTLEEVGEILGMSKEAVRKRVVRFMPRAKKLYMA